MLSPSAVLASSATRLAAAGRVHHEHLTDELAVAHGGGAAPVADLLWLLMSSDLLSRLLDDRGWSPDQGRPAPPA